MQPNSSASSTAATRLLNGRALCCHLRTAGCCCTQTAAVFCFCWHQVLPHLSCLGFTAAPSSSTVRLLFFCCCSLQIASQLGQAVEQPGPREAKLATAQLSAAALIAVQPDAFSYSSSGLRILRALARAPLRRLTPDTMRLSQFCWCWVSCGMAGNYLSPRCSRASTALLELQSCGLFRLAVNTRQHSKHLGRCDTLRATWLLVLLPACRSVWSLLRCWCRCCLASQTPGSGPPTGGWACSAGRRSWRAPQQRLLGQQHPAGMLRGGGTWWTCWLRTMGPKTTPAMRMPCCR